MQASPCVFCSIVAGEVPAAVVYDDHDFMAFLDSHPLFPGHVLLCPREHYMTITDLPESLGGPIFHKTQLLARAVENALQAEGTFIAVNNTVSQTVPHLHIHVVPRRRKDGLRGFFWPRQKYTDVRAQELVREAIERSVRTLLGEKDVREKDL